jgi:hypothetical protein
MACATALIILIGLAGDARDVSANGVGGTISLGTVSGNTVEVNTTRAVNAWSRFGIHVRTSVSRGVELTDIVGAGNVALGPWVCLPTVPAEGEYVFGCAGLESQSITAPSMLALLTFRAAGNGCIGVSLVAAPGDTALDTYTVDAATTTAQAVIVSTATARILIGAGTAADCSAPGALPATGSGAIPRASDWSWLQLLAVTCGAVSVGLGVRGRRARQVRPGALNLGRPPARVVARSDVRLVHPQ